MDNSKRPTKAAIEAALSAYYGEVDEAARNNACAWRIVTLSRIAITSGANNMQNARHCLLADSSHRNPLPTSSASRSALGPCGIRSAQAPIIDP